VKIQLPLLGFSKDSPPSYQELWKSTPGPRFPGFLRKKGCDALFSFRPSGFAPVRRLTPSIACGCISTRFRSWGSPRFMQPRSHNSRVCLPTLRSLPSARSDENPRYRVFSWGECHRCDPLRGPAFTILPSPLVLACSPRCRCEIAEPQGLAPRGGSVATINRFQPMTPGAPLGFDRPRSPIPRLSPSPWRRFW